MHFSDNILDISLKLEMKLLRLRVVNMNDDLNQIFARVGGDCGTASDRRTSVAARTTAAAPAESGRTLRGGNASATHETRRASAAVDAARAAVRTSVADAAVVVEGIRLGLVAATDTEIAIGMAAAAVARDTVYQETD